MIGRHRACERTKRSKEEIALVFTRKLSAELSDKDAIGQIRKHIEPPEGKHKKFELWFNSTSTRRPMRSAVCSRRNRGGTVVGTRTGVFTKLGTVAEAPELKESNRKR